MGSCLKDKVAVITGSGQGVGRGIALYFASQGAKVVTNNRKPMAQKAPESTEGLSEAEAQRMLALSGDAQTVADEIIRAGGEAVPFFGDVSDFDTARRLVETAISEFGRIDILVNNAAGLGEGTLINTTEESWDYQTRAKMKGAFNTMRHAVPHMIAQGGGTILNCASNAWIGMSNLCAYSAGNSGVVGLTKAAAKELAQYGITVNAYCPRAASPGHIREFAKTINTLVAAIGEAARPSGEKLAEIDAEHGDPVNLGPFLAYLCAPDGKAISGSVFGLSASGKIELYSEPVIEQVIHKENEPWTLEELNKAVPEILLKDYIPIAQRESWNKEIGEADKSSPKESLFGLGQSVEGFHGKAFLNMFMDFDHPSQCSAGNVTFGPGAHNDWHIHHGWQLLMAVSGKGIYQEWGKPAKIMHPGDVIVIEPGVKHWHGAAADSSFEHLGLILAQTAPTEGLEEVTAEQYQGIKA